VKKKWDFNSIEGNGRPSNPVVWCEEKIVVTGSDRDTFYFSIWLMFY
jgi:hypothetical protein